MSIAEIVNLLFIRSHNDFYCIDKMVEMIIGEMIIPFLSFFFWMLIKLSIGFYFEYFNSFYLPLWLFRWSNDHLCIQIYRCEWCLKAIAACSQNYDTSQLFPPCTVHCSTNFATCWDDFDLLLATYWGWAVSNLQHFGMKWYGCRYCR